MPSNWCLLAVRYPFGLQYHPERLKWSSVGNWTRIDRATYVSLCPGVWFPDARPWTIEWASLFFLCRLSNLIFCLRLFPRQWLYFLVLIISELLRQIYIQVSYSSKSLLLGSSWLSSVDTIHRVIPSWQCSDSEKNSSRNVSLMRCTSCSFIRTLLGKQYGHSFRIIKHLLRTHYSLDCSYTKQ